MSSCKYIHAPINVSEVKSQRRRADRAEGERDKALMLMQQLRRDMLAQALATVENAEFECWRNSGRYLCVRENTCAFMFVYLYTYEYMYICVRYICIYIYIRM